MLYASVVTSKEVLTNDTRDDEYTDEIYCIKFTVDVLNAEVTFTKLVLINDTRDAESNVALPGENELLR